MASAYTLKVDWSGLRGEVTKVQSVITDVDKAISDIRIAKAAVLNVAYVGTTATVFDQQLFELLKHFDALSILLGDYKAVLTQAASTYESNENTLTNIARALPN